MIRPPGPRGDYKTNKSFEAAKAIFARKPGWHRVVELPGREPRVVEHVRHALPSAPTHAAASIATTTTSSSGGGSSSDAALPVVTYIGRSINVQQRTLAHATGQGSRRVADAISQYGPHREVRRLLLLGLDDVNGLAPEALEDVLGPTLHPDGLEFMFGFVEQTGLEWLFARRPLHIKIANVNKGAFGVSVKSSGSDVMPLRQRRQM